ncbi:COMM domain-containing protein 3 [Phlebotomus argentipes]|uniref:COMM domain-containing protein 3 n=1 Tax=Phlebotomus argentipes TaxID=94469 RepID=UPI002893093A|nr:COMM domain-containing protein 3 [Phlebotomus argentipes]
MSCDKESLKFSQSVIRGLKCLDDISDNETVQKIIEKSIRKTTATDNAGSAPDILAGGSQAQIEYALVTIVVISAKHNLSSNELKYLLSQEKIRNTICDQICREYEILVPEVRARLSTYGYTEPFVANANWKMTCNVQSDSVDSNGELLYKITLEDFDGNSGGSKSITNFTCNTEELQFLIAKLKDIERHCDKIGNGK